MLKQICVFILWSSTIFGGNDSLKNSSDNIHQSYSGKFGFYAPAKELNNGLILGIDGITEFKKYNFLLSGAVDLYFKKTIDIFSPPKPVISDQTIILIPIHVNFAYKVLEMPDADTKVFLGIGGGYYLHFYSAQYRESGGILGGVLDKSTTQNGGDVFFTISGRILIGKIFVEPRFYLASKSSGSVDEFNYNIDPSGFAITLGFQY
ncbi:MAG: hypothetical protein R6W68_07430 [Ignavibacteriaceae bacterium]